MIRMKEKTTLSLVVVVLSLTSGIAVAVAANGSGDPMGLKAIAGYVRISVHPRCHRLCLCFLSGEERKGKEGGRGQAKKRRTR